MTPAPSAAFAALDERYERVPMEWLMPSKTNPRRHVDDAKGATR